MKILFIHELLVRVLIVLLICPPSMVRADQGQRTTSVKMNISKSNILPGQRSGKSVSNSKSSVNDAATTVVAPGRVEIAGYSGSAQSYIEYAGALDIAEKQMLARIQENKSIMLEFNQKVIQLLSKDQKGILSDITKPEVDVVGPAALDAYLKKIEMERVEEINKEKVSYNGECGSSLDRSQALDKSWIGYTVALGGAAVGGYFLGEVFKCHRNNSKVKDAEKNAKEDERALQAAIKVDAMKTAGAPAVAAGGEQPPVPAVASGSPKSLVAPTAGTKDAPLKAETPKQQIVPTVKVPDPKDASVVAPAPTESSKTDRRRENYLGALALKDFLDPNGLYKKASSPKASKTITTGQRKPTSANSETRKNRKSLPLNELNSENFLDRSQNEAAAPQNLEKRGCIKEWIGVLVGIAAVVAGVMMLKKKHEDDLEKLAKTNEAKMKNLKIAKKHKHSPGHHDRLPLPTNGDDIEGIYDDSEEVVDAEDQDSEENRDEYVDSRSKVSKAKISLKNSNKDITTLGGKKFSKAVAAEIKAFANQMNVDEGKMAAALTSQNTQQALRDLVGEDADKNYIQSRSSDPATAHVMNNFVKKFGGLEGLERASARIIASPLSDPIARQAFQTDQLIVENQVSDLEIGSQNLHIPAPSLAMASPQGMNYQKSSENSLNTREPSSKKVSISELQAGNLFDRVRKKLEKVIGK